MVFADVKARARRAVHTALAVPCLYSGPGGIAAVELTARFHDRKVVGGDLSSGYATIIEGVVRVVFNREELIEKKVVPRQHGRVRFPAYGMSFELDSRDPYDGPIDEKWSVAPL